MSGLSAFALGLAAQRSVKGQTWAGNNVFLEPTAPVDTSGTSPVICIYAGRGRSDVEGRDILNAAGDVRLRFEFILPASVVAAGSTFDTAASQAMVFAFLWRQVESAFLSEVSPWAVLWRELILRVHAVESGRDLFESDKGQKIPVMVVEWHCECLSSPPIGAEPCGIWAKFVAAMQADTAELAALASLMSAQIVGAAGDLPPWRSFEETILGLTRYETRAIGLGPLDEPSENLPEVAMSQGTLDDKDTDTEFQSTTLVDGVAQSFEDPPGDTQTERPVLLEPSNPVDPS